MNEHKETFLPHKRSFWVSMYNNIPRMIKYESPDNIINEINVPKPNERVDFAKEHLLKELPAYIRIKKRFFKWTYKLVNECLQKNKNFEEQ
jgi:hypothetical protein